eukprot:TRINITY_DN9666_c0_g1_i5.p1 TRINITY_DN9666_c0_g1~~TRINITY_DN9666_c0_g1_i5.p1  ORF type:complete len:280 (-),score=66.00 TRINITY_DN9666_c0_g1_i5:674-1513(-)
MPTVSTQRGQSDAAINKAEEVFQILQHGSPPEPVMKEVPVLPDITASSAEVESAEAAFVERARDWLSSIEAVLADSEHLMAQLQEVFGHPTLALALLSAAGKCAADSMIHLLGKRGLETEAADMMAMLEELAAVQPAPEPDSEAAVPQRIMEALCKDAVENVKSLGESLPPGLQERFMTDLFLLIEKCNSESDLLTGITLQIAGMWSALDAPDGQDLNSPSRRMAHVAAELLEAAAIVTQRGAPKIQERPADNSTPANSSAVRHGVSTAECAGCGGSAV